VKQKHVLDEGSALGVTTKGMTRLIDEGHYILRNEECYVNRDGEYCVRRNEQCYVKGIEYIIHGTLGSMIGKERHNREPKKLHIVSGINLEDGQRMCSIFGCQ